jgi:hypothetical protein
MNREASMKVEPAADWRVDAKRDIQESRRCQSQGCVQR